MTAPMPPAGPSRFRFRVWYDGKMRVVYSLRFCGCHQWLDEINVPHGDDQAVILDVQNAVVMQSTGLLDVNGREIFECEIVEFESEKGTETAVVLYDIPSASWILAYTEGFTLAGHTYHNADSISRIGSDVLESIGNVYQNPELLKSSSR